MGHDDREQPDVSRRDLGALLGILGGGAALSALAACSSDDGLSAIPEPLGRQIEAVTGTSVVWFNTIDGPCTNTAHTMTETPGPSNAYQVAIVFGYNTPGDGGGGVFYWDYTSRETADGGTIFQVSPVNTVCKLPITTGRWIRIYSGPLNVKWFGATGNGTTDDTSAIQNTFNAAAATGSSVFFPHSSYKVTAPIQVLFYGTSLNLHGHILGEGEATQLFGYNIGAGRAVLEILGNGNLTSGAPNYYLTAANIEVSNLSVNQGTGCDPQSFCMRVGDANLGVLIERVFHGWQKRLVYRYVAT
jgi:hypothetical protein